MLTLGYLPGVWDLIHVGHLSMIERARSLCDRLVVGVPSDDVVKEDKGSLPIITQEDRLRMVDALRRVDVALPYFRLEFLSHLAMLRPNVFFVGEHWGNEKRHQDAERWCKANRCRIIQLPYSHEESTTAIKERILGPRVQIGEL